MSTDGRDQNDRELKDREIRDMRDRASDFRRAGDSEGADRTERTANEIEHRPDVDHHEAHDINIEARRGDWDSISERLGIDFDNPILVAPVGTITLPVDEPRRAIRRIWWGELHWSEVDNVQFMGWDGHLCTFIATRDRFRRIRYGTLNWEWAMNGLQYIGWDQNQWTMNINSENNTFSVIRHGTLDWIHDQTNVQLLSWSGSPQRPWTDRRATIELT